jgi:hypothetical protein
VNPEIFNPLDKTNLGESVVRALLRATPGRLSELTSFNGAGLYVLYYAGANQIYRLISQKNQPPGTLVAPIYIGRAEPAGRRKGLAANPLDAGPILFNRLSEHFDTIDQTDDLKPTDFWVRCLIVDDIWIPLGEALLIRHFTPVWNSVLDGFGNHDPGIGRYFGARPDWDELHPGRSWAAKCAPAKRTKAQIIARVDGYLSQNY